MIECPHNCSGSMRRGWTETDEKDRLWTTRNSSAIARNLKRRKKKWPNCLVSQLRRFTATSRGGGPCRRPSNGRYFSSSPAKIQMVIRPKIVGRRETALMNARPTVRLGNFKPARCAGSSMGRFATDPFRNHGKKKWLFVDPVRSSRILLLHSPPDQSSIAGCWPA